MTDNIVQMPGPDLVKGMLGPEVSGHIVIVDGRAIPKMVAHDRGDQIDFILDGRFSFMFPRELAYHAASFAAQALAIGEGFSSMRTGRREVFAPEVHFVATVG